MINGVHHPALVAIDLEGLAGFYLDKFGFEKVWKLEASDHHIAFLRAGNAYLELFQYFQPPATRAPRRSKTDSGPIHFCLDVTDIDHEYARLTAAGVEFESPPMAVGALRYCFCFDPEGNCIELLELTDDRVPFHLSRAAVPVATQRAQSDWDQVQHLGDEIKNTPVDE